MSQDVGIEVNRASVHTLALSVQVMKLDKRQVTLAVFRQLDNLPLVDRETGAFAGTPWGRVNYHLPDCTGEKHLHIVWQKGDRLFRAAVSESWPLRSSAPYEKKELDDLIQDGALELWLLSDAPLDLPHETKSQFNEAANQEVLQFLIEGETQPWKIPLGSAIKRREKEASYSNEIWSLLHGKFRDAVERREDAKRRVASDPDGPHASFWQKDVDKPLPDEIRSRAEGLVSLRKGLNAEELTGQLNEDLLKLRRLHELLANGPGRWAAAYAKLAAMDQLFIAT